MAPDNPSPELKAPAQGAGPGSAEEGTLGVDVRGLVRYCSPGAEAIFRMPAGSLAGRALNELIPRLRFSVSTPGMNRMLALSWSGARGWLRLEGRSAARGEFALDAALTSVSIDSSRLFVVSLRDANGTGSPTERVRRVVESVAEGEDAVMLTDAEGIIEYVNPGFERITGFASEDVVGRTPRILNSGAHPAAEFAALWEALRAGREFRAVLVNRRKDGSTFQEEKSIRPLFDDRGVVTHFLSVGRDVTAQAREVSRLERLAHYDELTGLANRSLFGDRLRRAIAHAARHRKAFALLYLDLDGFKALNDEFGHACGDVALQEVGRRLHSCVREEDTVARVGGDEFAVILAGAGSREAAQVPLDKIARALRAALPLGECSAALRASVGACLYPEDGEDDASLLRRADAAMYRAKAQPGGALACAWAEAS